MWIQAEQTGEHPQITCSVFKETTISLLLSPTPSSPKAACYDDRRSMGLGKSMSEVRVLAPLYANCEILDKLLGFEVSV